MFNNKFYCALFVRRKKVANKESVLKKDSIEEITKAFVFINNVDQNNFS